MFIRLIPTVPSRYSQKPEAFSLYKAQLKCYSHHQKELDERLEPFHRYTILYTQYLDIGRNLDEHT